MVHKSHIRMVAGRIEPPGCGGAGWQVVGTVDDLRRGLQDLATQAGHPVGEGEDRGAVDVDGSTVVATRSPMPAQAARSHAHRMPGDGGGMRPDGTGLPFGAAGSHTAPGATMRGRRSKASSAKSESMPFRMPDGQRTGTAALARARPDGSATQTMRGRRPQPPTPRVLPCGSEFADGNLFIAQA